ncbi:dipeptidase [Parvibaculum indicum]|uniref:carcinine hydrolase/isopenicillin-N N-acyltransferase family protein n=1 Tax=Parvibaculum indicum TaxID=562969 RepID=UPI00141E8674|nr:carcinine hydrolase/isopenicillin-N N-acyltransferase family protein [Parvibaculum indicum]NIJ40806.1 dipeptidase [Parvibaculum indicum]
MCDTMVALPQASAKGAVLFAKNSDREANEAQYLCPVAAAEHEAGAELTCTYIAIPQVRRTHAVLLSRPYWMWGAEMGSNEHGVVIGNEAVHAKVPPQSEPALIGMDLLRLGLERCASADEALDVITSLLERHGQGGNCAHTGRFEYHNSFIIADRLGAAYVLETVGREWAAQRVSEADGYRRAISNAYTIGTRIDRASAGLVSQAVEKGFADKSNALDFEAAYANRGRSRLSSGHQRWCRASELLGGGYYLTPAAMMANLRDRGRQAAMQSDWRPDGILAGSICAHATYGPVRRFGQTTQSWVAEYRDGWSVHWMTASAAPDTGIFRPVFFGPGMANDALPDFGPVPGGHFDARARWWRHEQLHRAVLRNYPDRMAAYATERDRLEARFLSDVDALMARNASPEEAAALARGLWAEADRAETRWLDLVRSVPETPAYRPSPPMAAHWASLNRRARMPA